MCFLKIQKQDLLLKPSKYFSIQEKLEIMLWEDTREKNHGFIQSNTKKLGTSELIEDMIGRSLF